MIREIEWIYSASRGLERIDDTFGGQTHTLEFSGRMPRPNRVDYTLPGQVPWRVAYNWNNAAEFPVLVQANADGTSVNRIIVEEYRGQAWGMSWTHPDGGGNRVRLVRRPNGAIVRTERKTSLGGGSAPDSVSYRSYDALGRLAEIRHEDAAGLLLHPNGQLTYVRDPEGRALSEEHAANTVSYSYDVEGQLTSADHTNPAYPDESYGFDAAGNRITSHLAPLTATVEPGNRITSAGDFDYEYDNAGNLVRRTDTVSGEVTEFGYDHRNRLILATVHPSLGAPATTSVEWQYDYRDRLLYRIVNGQKDLVHPRSRSRHRGVHRRRQPTERGLPLRPVDTGPDLRRMARRRPRGALVPARCDRLDPRHHRRELHGTELGRLRRLRQPAAGQRTGQRRPLRFAARPFLDEINLYDNRRRFLDPYLGRFTQEDPIRHGGRDFNFYRYAMNQPTVFTDPTGEISAVNLLRIVNELLLPTINEFVNSSLGAPCSIANATAAGFAWFDIIADVVTEPTKAKVPPSIDQSELFAETNCNSRDK